MDELKNFDKPREKLVKKWVESLKDYELLAIVLGSSTKDKDVLKLSREIIKLFEDALTDGAASIILAHNHPSGELNASSEDILITSRLNESAKLLGIEIPDHIIFSKNGYLSMRDKGLF